MSLVPENIPLSTGHEVVDGLRALQIAALAIDDTKARLHAIQSGVHKLRPAETLLGRRLIIDSGLVLAREPDSDPRSLIIFNKGLLFEAEAESLAMFVDDDIPLNDLTLDFSGPELIMTDTPEEAAYFRRLAFKVPVMGIANVIAA
jgi:hypothetical protein